MLFLVYIAFFAFSAKGDVDETAKMREKLAFVERNLVNVIVKGSFPKLYSASTARISECGCEYSPSKITFGSRVGMTCKLYQADAYKPECGARCTSPRGEELVLLCPRGWMGDCERGCVPPAKFKTTSGRIYWLEVLTLSVVEQGYDFLTIQDDVKQSCGCTSCVRAINFGTKLGLECIFDEDKVDDQCRAYRDCANAANDKVAIFCPAGFHSTCDGCKKVETRTLTERADWMVTVLSGFISEVIDILQLYPSSREVLRCGCRTDVLPISYGNGIGHYCNVDFELVPEDCGTNVVCKDKNENDLIHFCPDGWTPSCELGCGYAWEKSEL